MVAEVKQMSTAGFVVEHAVTLPGTPTQVYDLITGDISPWWDHSFSDKPHKLYIDATPGGGFYELFNEKGDGALHATVIYAERGKKIRFDGPLGLSGQAVTFVTTYVFEPLGADSTRLTMSAHASGEIQEGIPATVDRVWHHFLVERFKPYAEGRLGGGRK